MKVEIWSDFACPFCYIGKKRFERALAEFAHKDEVEVVYKAYQLNPNAPKVMVGTAYENFAKSHHMSEEGARKRFNMFTENAKTEGLVYNYDIIQMTNTIDAHRLAKWSAQFGAENMLTDRFMKAYFSEGKNLADHQTLLEMVKELKLDVAKAKAVLESDDFKLESKQEMEEGSAIGVQGVPFFVIDRKFGISGAQELGYFKQALDQIYAESKPIKKVEIKGDAGATCDDESCEVKK
jgi:predicted DsbA family dithiol-disulfide isomerase